MVPEGAGEQDKNQTQQHLENSIIIFFFYILCQVQ